MRKALALGSAAAAGGLLLSGATPPPKGPIAYHVSSWGSPVEQWEVQPDGSIVYATVGENWRPGSSVPMTTATTRPSPARYQWLANLLAPASKWAGKPLPCKVTMTDAPYGDMRWNGGPPLSFNGGFTCSDKAVTAALQSLQTATVQVRAWVKKDSQPVPTPATGSRPG